MAKYKLKKAGTSFELTQNEFVAQGGEGSIYILGDRVYKVCLPGKMIPEQKFDELNALDHPKIIKPDDIILERNKPVGYTMPAVPNKPMPLVQLLTKSFRQRENVTPDHMANLVRQKSEIIRHIHSHKGYLEVDGNECNAMVTSDFKELYAIDVNSYQTPSFPADAIMASIRDWHVAKDANGTYIWTQASDWYSFAILSWYMFTGIHPFKGVHPNFPNAKTRMADQMLACKSVLDPEVLFPKGAVYFPFEDVIPGGAGGAYMQWYRAILVDNKRMPAPKDFQAALAFIAKVKAIVGSNNFDIRELRNTFDMIVGHYDKNGKEVIVTKNSLFFNSMKLNRPADRFRIGFTKGGITYACWLEGNEVKLQNLETGQPIPCDIVGSNIMSCEGRVYVQSLGSIMELEFIEQNALICTARQVAQIMPNATQLYQGVAIQDMFGNKMFSVFPETHHHRSVSIPELNGYRIVDAKYEGNVLMIVGLEGETGKYARFVCRFAKDWSGHDIRIIDDITPSGLNFTVLPQKGLCLCITEDETMEIFQTIKDSPHIRLYTDPAIDGEMKLCHSGDQARFARGDHLYSISIK